MSQFYNRYIPPAQADGALPQSRSTRGQEVDDKKGKKRGRAEKRTNSVSKPLKSERTGRAILDKYSSIGVTTSQDKDANVVLRKKRSRSSDQSADSNLVEDDGLGQPENEEQAQHSKHSDVFARLRKSKENAQRRAPVDQMSNDSMGQPTQDLIPIPQPETSNREDFIPSFSVLPTWQSNATGVEDATASFHQLGLSEDLILNLKKEGIETAFPIQHAVIPRLLRYSNRDLCISAATGSGKTLAYVVPIIEQLKKDGTHGLRAVVVVPTRELVKQVKEIAEICAVGSKIKIATAFGSKSLDDEQKQLVEEIEIYDPATYRQEMERPVDWTTFSLTKLLNKGRQTDRIESTDWITRARSRVDVLITTPGRLVDHLQNTDGFNLDNVQWLVVDEADRLLNESYQEWISTVVPALESRGATKEADELLTHMRMELPPRVVRKILLSATMTQDISKLNSMGLVDPELVVLGASHKPARRQSEVRAGEESDDADVADPSEFNLPDSLQEIGITLKPDAAKPLVLFELLREHIGIDSTLDNESATSDSSSESSEPSEAGDRDTRKQKNPRVLIFTRSTASATRLSRLLTIIEPSLESCIATLTRSTASSASSRQALSAFKSRRKAILIATDRASRGIDVPDLEHVLNYDIPNSAATYIHRVGRTARAGKTGKAWTLVEHREGRWFWSEIGGRGEKCKVGRSGKIKKMEVRVEDEAAMTKYEQALQTLGTEVRQE